jgi:hypothetical protein
MLRWQEAERRRVAEKPKPVSFASRIAAGWKGVTTVTLSLAAVVAVGIVVISITSSILDGNISIEPLSVPKSMTEAGLTADVAALRLKDAINSLAEKTPAPDKPTGFAHLTRLRGLWRS